MAERAESCCNHSSFLFIFVASLLLMFNTGCSSQKVWSYRIEPESMSQSLISSSVAVPPFSDHRENKNTNLIALYMIPVVPFGWQDLHTPEGIQMHTTSGMWLWRPNEDIAKATAEELAAAHLFKECFFTFRESDAKLVMKGEITSTDYNGKILSYGVSFFAPYLWLVGFPVAHVKNELDLNFKLISKKDKQVLWQKSYHRKIGKLNWIYVTRADFEYSTLLKEILLEVVSDLKQDLPKIQPDLALSGA